MKTKNQVTGCFGRLTSGLVLFALAHQMASAEVIVQEVTIPRDNLNLPGVIFYDSSITAQKPAVAMLHGCSGMWRNGIPHELDPVTQQPRVEQYLDKWGRRLAEAGYIAVAVDSYTARRPADRTESAWQDQCNWEYDQGVSENTVRPGDAEAARAWLAARSDVKADKIGLMGWSQGATAAMVAMGATPIDSKTLRTEASTKPFKGAVAFYPGCGFKYGEDIWAFNGTSYSYWRPYAPVRINHGSHDQLYDAAYVKETDTFDLDPLPKIRHHCEIRVDRAKTVYGASKANGNEVTLAVMPDAHHSFDYPHQTGFPAEPCAEPGHPADVRAECVYDLESLSFLDSLLK
jgi:dienelactone hydrolase